MTPSEFRAQFPDHEFDNTTSFPDAYIQGFLDKAAPAFNATRWGKWYSEGLACYVAANIVVSKARAARGLKIDNGAMTEKHVGPVGASFDGNLLAMQAKDTFMVTDYGRRYCELRNKVGHGGLTVP